MIYMIMAIVVALSSTQLQDSYEGFMTGLRANAVKGTAFYQRGDGKFTLEAGHKLQEGDFIKTEKNSYAELLLQPGNYLRVGGDSEFQILSEPNDRMRLRLNYGSITLEIMGREGEDSSDFYESLSQRYELIRVITPNSVVFITRPGIFRINSSGAARTEMIVRDGEAVINGRRVKEKRSGVASSQGVVIAEINSKVEDDFDSWGRERAEVVVRANRSLKHDSPWAKNLKREDDAIVDLPEEQNKSKRFVVSARPGAVTFVEAGVEFMRKAKDWEPLTEKSQLETGDKLRTSVHAFCELSILPDMNLRLDTKSEILFEELSNDEIVMKLLQGSAILDVTRFNKKEVTDIQLGGAALSVVIADQGNYRIDVRPNRDEITVRDGKVIFKERSVGGCRKITAETVSDCDRKIRDSFDFWSDHRGEGKYFNGYDVIAMSAHLDRIRRLRFRNTGFWYQNPGKTDYTFVPFYSTRFRSPYGRNYSTVLSPRDLRRHIYLPLP